MLSTRKDQHNSMFVSWKVMMQKKKKKKKEKKKKRT